MAKKPNKIKADSSTGKEKESSSGTENEKAKSASEVTPPTASNTGSANEVEKPAPEVTPPTASTPGSATEVTKPAPEVTQPTASNPGSSTEVAKPVSVLDPADERKLIQALCAEKEGNYEVARDLFIELNKKDDAVRCSSMNYQKSWRKESKPGIIGLAILTGLFIICFVIALVALNNKQRNIKPAEANWGNPGNVELSNTPAWFLYDQKAKKIRTKASINESMKQELEKAYPWSTDSTNYTEFRRAVETLAFQSTDMKGRYYWLLLLVSGLAAVVGVIVREVLDLIRHFCYEKDLDFKVWWPWYVLRPFVGFVIGIIVVLFSGTDLLFSSTGNSSETYLIAIAVIAGISVEDVMFKIRKVSQVLFGNRKEDETTSSESDGDTKKAGKRDQDSATNPAQPSAPVADTANAGGKTQVS